MKSKPDKTHKVNLVIHGGAGNLSKAALVEKKVAQFKKILKKAMDLGFSILKKGGTSEYAVVQVVKILEDSKLFNAGKGSVLDARGGVTMDAAIMLGQNRHSGAVIGTSWAKNPICIAQRILHQTVHNILCGEGADEFAIAQKLDVKPLSYFVTKDKQKQLLEAQKKNAALLDHSDEDEEANEQESSYPENKFGTVGAVALDQFGNLAAATSTGGLTNKKFGRVGDSPIIGAGTFADNKTCAISATGRGEDFITHTPASEVHYRMLFKKEPLEKACAHVVNKILNKDVGGLIALDRHGNIAISFNTRIMFRAFKNKSGRTQIKIQ